MEILLNGNKLEIEGIDNSSTVFELIKTVEESLKGTDRTIVEVYLDGVYYASDDVTIGSLKVLSFKKIELNMVTSKEMVLEGFKDFKEGIEYLEGISEDITSELRIGNIKPAMELFVSFSDAIGWLLAMFDNADRAFAGNMAESSLEMERINIVKRIREQALALSAAQANENWVEVADIIEYEFSEIYLDARTFVARLLK